jgi:flagellar protein FlbT
MINGVVITNTESRAALLIHNQAQILPGRMVMQEDVAVTPTRRLYFAAQLLFMSWLDHSRRAECQGEFDQRATQLLLQSVDPELRAGIQNAQALIANGEGFKALKLLKGLVDREMEVSAPANEALPEAFTDGRSSALRGK